jgi:hypothetical protein
MKTCTKCGVEKPLDEFYRNVNGVGGLQWWCKACSKQFNDAKRSERRGLDGHFGLYFSGACDLCGTTDPGHLRGWSIDHDHDHCGPGSFCIDCVRGVVCHPCNVTEGHVRAAIERQLIVTMTGPLAEYLRGGGPFQRWRRATNS